MASKAVNVYIKYAPGTVDVTGALIERLDIWRKATDGVGSFNVQLKNDLGEWLGQFGGDDPIQIKIDNAIFLEGYLDRGFPRAYALNEKIKRIYELIGRDYGQDLQNKIVNKSGDWVYEPQPVDDIVDNMLAQASVEITFSSPSTGPEVSYSDRGDEYLQEAFRKLMERTNYDYYVDENKVLQMFAIGSIDSGITLKNVANASDNNILDLRKTEFDTMELRNYIIGKSDYIQDGWTEDATDFTQIYGALTNNYTVVKKGVASIQCAAITDGLGYSASWFRLAFPKHNFDYLPFDTFGSEALTFWIRIVMGTFLQNPKIYIILEDDQGLKIRYDLVVPSWGGHCGCNNKWRQFSVPVGTEVDIGPYNDWVLGRWKYHENPGSSEFNWKIKKIDWYADTDKNEEIGGGAMTAMLLDALSIPLMMVSYKQDATSQSSYKVRHISVPAKDVRSQVELDEAMDSELAKRKDPIVGLKVIALGSAGIIGGACKWIPGHYVTVNSPDDGINNVKYRITEVQISIADYPIFKGQDFVAYVTLVPYQAVISGKRLAYIEDPEAALLRSLHDYIRYMERKEEAEDDWFPPIPASLAEKIQLGDFMTLAESAVKFTREFEAENCNTNGANVSVISEAAASNGYFVRLTSGQASQYLCRQSSIRQGGEFTAIFRLRVSSNASGSAIARIGAVKDGVGWLDYWDIAPNYFPQANVWRYFATKVSVDDDIPWSLAVYFNTGVANLDCDIVGFLPASVPLGYSDVTVNTTDPGSVGDNVDPGSTGDNVDPGSITTGGYMVASTVISLTSGSYQEVDNAGSEADGYTLLRSGTVAGMPSDPMNMCMIWTVIEKEANDQEWGNGAVRLDINGSVYADDTSYFSDDLRKRVKYWLIPIQLANGQTIKILAKKDGSGNFDIRASLYAYQFRQHTHPITGDAHTTPISGDAHTTPISGDSHNHTNSPTGHEHREPQE